ncbi:CocE/NonD family hydrolase [Patulibacter defluvii]|uniref:CocE/NonD family hydrolase n=1 Tax=Patulibacter defluvii TaxID=3095358 RepID=UPI002A755F8C|nr:CocE/NonD family hydrolase [Patulibacter sp. DM4]
MSQDGNGGGRFGVQVERDVAVPMRDGTVLRADVWRPAGDGRHPTLLQRLPYDKASSFVTVHLCGLEPLRAVEAGFAVVVQDVRGCFASDGDFVPFVHEARDGADTIAWIAAQPFSDGRVAMYGASYVGATQMLAATQAPPALRAIAPNVTGAEYYEGWAYRGGVPQLGFTAWWALGFAADALARRRAAGADVGEQEAELARLLADPTALYERLPLDDQPLLRELAPAFLDWLAHPEHDDYWRATAVSERYGAIAVPALHVGGWSDIFVDGTLRNYVGLRDGAATEEARAGQRLLVGPWSHGNGHEAVGNLDFGPEASQLAIDMTAIQLDFFARVLAGRPFETPPVRIFVMGANRWRDEDQWPIARARPLRLHLSSDGHANGADGDGVLAPAPPAADAPPDVFLYDPRDPVPTVGGATLLPDAFVGRRAGPRDQREVERRGDVLVYTGEPLAHDLEVTGTVRVTLTVASSAPDSDWTATLVDVHPDGRAIGVSDGIVRTRYRHSRERADPVAAGTAVALTIELGATSMLFRAGHRLRLQVSSSNFPRFARHPNGDDPLAAELRPALQTVFHDGARPSYVELPVVPAR